MYLDKKTKKGKMSFMIHLYLIKFLRLSGFNSSLHWNMIINQKQGVLI